MRGAPGLSPGALSLVTVLQFAEDLTDLPGQGLSCLNETLTDLTDDLPPSSPLPSCVWPASSPSAPAWPGGHLPLTYGLRC